MTCIDCPWLIHDRARSDRHSTIHSMVPIPITIGRQRGIILLVALIAIIALAFGGVALVRAVMTGVVIGANVAARQQAMLAATIAVEQDNAALFETGAIADLTRDAPARNYFAARQSGEDPRGVPRALQAAADYPPGAGVIDAGAGFTARHVIERLCLLPGPATVSNCMLSPPSIAAAAGTPSPAEPPRTPYYRVTIRVEGTRGAATFVQAMLGEETAHHRLSWRVLED